MHLQVPMQSPRIDSNCFCSCDVVGGPNNYYEASCSCLPTSKVITFYFHHIMSQSTFYIIIIIIFAPSHLKFDTLFEYIYKLIVNAGLTTNLRVFFTTYFHSLTTQAFSDLASLRPQLLTWFQA